MRRRLVTIAILLLAGAVMNVAVAWGCALWLRPTEAAAEKVESEVSRCRWFVARWPHAPTRLWFSRRVAIPDAQATGHGQSHPEDLLPRWSPIREPLESFRSGRVQREERIVMAHGWPLLALWVELRPSDSSATTNRIDAIGGFQTAWSWSGGSLEPLVLPRTLPWRPIASGMLGNTLFFAVILWIAKLAAGVVSGGRGRG